MKRILVFGMTEVAGGVESFLMNYYRHMDRQQLQFDFLCNTHQKIAYENEIIAMGGKTYHITARSDNYLIYRKELKTFFSTAGKLYDTIWVNVSSLANIDYLKMAKKYGISRRIIHSHNSMNMDSKLRGILHKRNKRNIQKYATDFWACSRQAADWFYDYSFSSKIVIIKNAVDVKKMEYSTAKRNEKRMQLHMSFKNQDRDGMYLVGNVGRLHYQKNQIFLLDVFSEFIKKVPEAKLAFIGKGPDEKKLKEYVEKLQLTKDVFFLGQQDHIQDWLSAMDIFLFPSLFEGLSIAALEAQANGVPILASTEASPKEIQICPNYFTLSLSESAKQWADLMAEIRQTEKRMEPEEIIRRFNISGYNITIESEKLYQKLMG